MCVVYFVNVLQTRPLKLAYLIIYRADFGENFLLIMKKNYICHFYKEITHSSNEGYKESHFLNHLEENTFLSKVWPLPRHWICGQGFVNYLTHE